MGFIALFGVAVQNGIIMVANINRVRRQGMDLREAVLEGAAERFPQEALASNEVKDRLTEAIGSLPEREQLVVALYYYENLTLREIGEVLGVTESRVSQLHTKAVMRLKSHLQQA